MTESILIIDDEAALRDPLTLKKDGFSGKAVEDGRSVVDLIKNRVFIIV